MKPSKESAGKSPQADDLRRKAEQHLGKKTAKQDKIPVEKDSRALVHELQVHQIELEMQNEELLLAQAATQELSNKYADLFDFAPTGYFLWDQSGKILEINMAGAALLRLDRNADLLGRRGGEALRCLHAPDDPRGCGFGPHCQDCTVRRTVLDTFETGRNHHQIEASLPFAIEGKPQDITFLLSTAKLNVRGQPQVLVTIQDVTDRKRAEEALQKAHDNLELRVQERTAQLRAMAVELTKSEQTERDRLAQLLHDELQQLLFAARMKVGVLRNSVVDEQVGQTIDQIDDLLKQSISETRSLAVELSPPILKKKGLTAGLQWLAGQMKDKHGLTVTVHAESEIEPLNEGVRILLYQVVKELLFNVAKHAQTDCAQVKIARTAQGQVHIEVSNNGVGFDPDKMQNLAESGGGFGLSSIRQRLEVLGGSLKVDSTPGKGTRMVIQAP